MAEEVVSRIAYLLAAVCQRLFGMVRPKRATTLQPLLDLSPYQQRALALFDPLRRAAVPEERLRELGVFADQLEALVEELKQLQTSRATYQPLEDLHVKIRKLLAQDFPFRSKIAKVWLEAEEALRKFVTLDPHGK